MIQSIKVRGFLQQFNYKIIFLNSLITFITAPNGYGKTTILNVIDFLFEEQWKDLCSIVFDTIEIELSNDHIRIIKENRVDDSYENIESDQKRTRTTLSVYLNDAKCVVATCIFDDDGSLTQRIKVKKEKDYKIAFKLFLINQKHFYIAENRLYKCTKDAEKDYLAVEAYRDAEFTHWLIELSDKARQILASKESDIHLTNNEEGCNLEKFWKQVQEFGLVNSLEDKPALSKIAMLYSSLHNDVEKLSLFAEIIKQSEFTNKKMTINPKYGFIFQLNDEYNSILDLANLSSGEKQILTIVYRLLFDKNVEKGSIVLIDEPELSFHMSWQLTFLKTLRHICKIKPMQFIIATHSPQIFELNFNNAIDLFELSEQKN